MIPLGKSYVGAIPPLSGPILQVFGRSETGVRAPRGARWVKIECVQAGCNGDNRTDPGKGGNYVTIAGISAAGDFQIVVGASDGAHSSVSNSVGLLASTTQPTYEGMPRTSTSSTQAPGQGGYSGLRGQTYGGGGAAGPFGGGGGGGAGSSIGDTGGNGGRSASGKLGGSNSGTWGGGGAGDQTNGSSASTSLTPSNPTGGAGDGGGSLPDNSGGGVGYQVNGEGNGGGGGAPGGGGGAKSGGRAGDGARGEVRLTWT